LEVLHQGNIFCVVSVKKLDERKKLLIKGVFRSVLYIYSFT